MIEGVGIYDYKVASPLSWEDNFPTVYGHTSVSYLKHCSGFEEAKHGDIQAAFSVVNMCIKSNRITELKERYPSAVLLPIVANNKLPEAFAQKIGMEIHTEVYTLESQSRKTLSAMERLLHKPCFDGRINEGVDYVIVDDVVTQGGTISALRKYVILNGGTVAAVTALAFSTDSQIIAPDIQDIYNLINKFTFTLIIDIIKKYNIANDVWELTRSQVRYLLRFEKIENIIDSIAKLAMSYECAR